MCPDYVFDAAFGGYALPFAAVATVAAIAMQWFKIALIMSLVVTAFGIYHRETSSQLLPRAAAAAASHAAKAASLEVCEFLKWDKEQIEVFSTQFLVLVVLLNGTEVSIKSCGAMRVCHVKQQIAQKVGVDIHRQVLVGGGGELDDEDARLFQILASGLVVAGSANRSAAVVMVQLLITEEGDQFSKHKTAKRHHSLIKCTEQQPPCSSSNRQSHIEGHSYMRPIRGQLVCTNGVHEWILRVEGSNQLFVGVAVDVLEHEQKDTRWYQNKDCWGIELRRKQMWFGGKRHLREEGPVKFDVPCEVVLKLDCRVGTLKVGVRKQMSQVMVCDSIPTKQTGCGMVVAVATYGSRCKVSILSHKSTLT